MGRRRTQEQPPALPPLGDVPGDWWELKRPHAGRCWDCGAAQGGVTVQVLAYAPEADPGDELARQFPAWPSRGWLVEWVCSACHGHRAMALAAEAVTIFGKMGGGWMCCAPAAIAPTRRTRATILLGQYEETAGETEAA